MRLDVPPGPSYRTLLRYRSAGLLLELYTLRVPPMSEVTRILSAIEHGDPHAAGQLLLLVQECP